MVGISTYKGCLLNGIPVESVLKLADTPQELIEVGDLVKVHWQHSDTELPLQEVIRCGEFIATQSASVKPRNILEIWTKTSEDTYTRQWRKE